MTCRLWWAFFVYENENRALPRRLEFLSPLPSNFLLFLLRFYSCRFWLPYSCLQIWRDFATLLPSKGSYSFNVSIQCCVMLCDCPLNAISSSDFWPVAFFRKLYTSVVAFYLSATFCFVPVFFFSTFLLHLRLAGLTSSSSWCLIITIGKENLAITANDRRLSSFLLPFLAFASAISSTLAFVRGILAARKKSLLSNILHIAAGNKRVLNNMFTLYSDVKFAVRWRNE